MRKRFSYGHCGKLVRDKCIERGLADDSTCKFSYKYLEDHEFQTHLFNKLQEEVLEILESKNKEQICSELVDVLDVVDAIRKHNNISKQELSIAQKHKHKIRGKFDSKLFIEWHEMGPSQFYYYCLENSDKYPEIEIKFK